MISAPAGPATPAAPAEPVRWGVLSTALINSKLLAGARLSERSRIGAVASRDADRARAFADRWDIAAAYGSYDNLLADPDIEAVYIPLPNSLHHVWTMRALAAGKHVLCEKPYSRDPGEVAVAFAEADRRGLVLSEAFMFRYHPQTVALAREVTAGAIGQLRLIVGSFSWPTGGPDDIRLDPALGGGSLMDVGVYPLSAARLLAGEPTSVTAQQVVGGSFVGGSDVGGRDVERGGVDVSFVATLAFPDDVVAHLDCGFHQPDRSHLEVVGTTGTLTVTDPWHCLHPGLTRTVQGSEPVEVPVEAANSYAAELDQFARAVRGEPNQLLGLADALGQARAVHALYAAAASPR